jgi:copper resistance protein D
MAIDALLIAARFVHLFAASLLFGAACFPLYAVSRSTSEADKLPAWLPPVLSAAAVVSLFSGVAWLLLLAAQNSANIADLGEAIVSIVPEANYGWVWPFRLALAASLLVLLPGRHGSTRRLLPLIAASLVLLASLALTGNPANNQGETGFQHRLVDAIHLVASGVWIGALAIFALLAIRSVTYLRDDEVQMFRDSLSRFSEVGTIAVAVLTFSGMLNPAFFLSSLRTPYGQLLAVKIAFFVAMLGLAALNRFWLTPRLAAAVDSAGQGTALRALRISIVLEAALGVLVFALVAWVGTLQPPT